MWIFLEWGGYKMIIQEFNLGNTLIQIDNTYYPKSEEERNNRYNEFNKIGCEIIRKHE